MLLFLVFFFNLENLKSVLFQVINVPALLFFFIINSLLFYYCIFKDKFTNWIINKQRKKPPLWKKKDKSINWSLNFERQLHSRKLSLFYNKYQIIEIPEQNKVYPPPSPRHNYLPTYWWHEIVLRVTI